VRRDIRKFKSQNRNSKKEVQRLRVIAESFFVEGRTQAEVCDATKPGDDMQSGNKKSQKPKRLLTFYF